ncbi:hypothetical protein [Sphingomonas bacterium]|nr:hypothetical protein [Sphingomonas bacterium]
MADNSNVQVVRVPRPADGVGAALRAAWGGGAALPAEWLKLIQRLDRR